MPYTLDQFVADARAALQAENNANGREKVRLLVEKLLQNQDFVAATFPVEATVGRHKVHEEPDQGFVVLAHVTGDAGKSPPHDHGSSWAVYGQVSGYTDMTVWKRTDGGSGGGEATLEKVNGYRLNPGQVGRYDVGRRALHRLPGRRPLPARHWPGLGLCRAAKIRRGGR